MPGKCKYCLDVKLCIAKHGVWVDCSRIKGLSFVPFDIVRDFPHHIVFHFKARGRVFPIPHDCSDDDEDDRDEVTDNDNQEKQQTKLISNKKGLLSISGRKENESAGNDVDDDILFLGTKEGNTEKAMPKIIKQEIEVVDGTAEPVNKSSSVKGNNNSGEGPAGGANGEPIDQISDGNPEGQYSGGNKRRIAEQFNLDDNVCRTEKKKVVR